MGDDLDGARLRDLVPQVIGVLVRRGADFVAAEDATQDALLAALETWPTDPPRDPKAWLITADSGSAAPSGPSAGSRSTSPGR